MNNNDEVIEIQKYGLEILSKFHEICEQNQLRYILDYGTLLGAVRHKGFIPWDDDVDVAMPREDFEKFKKIVDKYLPQDMFFQIHNTDKNYYLPLAKIRKKNGDFREQQLAHFDIVHGPWIDIFVYDFKYENREKEVNKQQELRDKRKFYGYISPDYSQDTLSNQSSIKVFLKKAVISVLKKSQNKSSRGFIMKYLDFKYRDLKETIDNRPNSNNSGELMTYSFAVNKNNTEKSLTLNINDFNQREASKFEDKTFYIPSGYDDILRGRYGDYMELPPVKERKSNHLWA